MLMWSATSGGNESTSLLKSKSQTYKNRKGILLLDENHPQYNILASLRLGIKNVIESSHLHAEKSLLPENYNAIMDLELTTEKGQTYQFISYANAVFIKMREAIGVSEEIYLQSLCTLGLPYWEFISNTKSGQEFYISNDRCFFIKSDTRYYVQAFLSFLGDYIDHMIKYPHNLLTKILGLYSVIIPGQKQMYFIVMQNICFPDSEIDERFDLKGCSAARYEKPPPPGSSYVHVLMDINFKHTILDIGKEKAAWLIRQLEIDCDFLAELGLQDYSLVIGIGKKIAVQNQNNGCHDMDTDSIDSEVVSLCSSEENSMKAMPLFSFYQPLEGSGNTRELTNLPNSIHTIEGTHKHYYIGIVDFFMRYECLQWGRRIKKNILFCHGDHSTIPPRKYSNRIVNFLKKHLV